MEHVNCEISIWYPSGYVQMHIEIYGKELIWKLKCRVLQPKFGGAQWTDSIKTMKNI